MISIERERPGHREAAAHAAPQPFQYPLRREFAEPDWRRLPGFREVTAEQWESAQWQRTHTVKNLRELKAVLGDHLTDELAADMEQDQRERATMSMLLPPQMLNTIDERDLRETKQQERWELMLDYLRATPSVRDVVVSGGDVVNLPIKRLEAFVSALLDIEHIRDVRLATKGLMGIPQHFLQPQVQEGLAGLAAKARERGVDLAVHTHVNCAQQITPLVARAVRSLLDMGFRDVRNQGVLLRGVNTTPNDLLELCFTLLDRAKVMPYYFYMCDMIPNAEHWRIAVHEAQELQRAIMGYLPGFATPRVVCDVPFVGKRWVHQVDDYDRELGISYWTKNYRTGIEFDDPDALERRYPYYDPIRTLPESGRESWRARVAAEALTG